MPDTRPDLDALREALLEQVSNIFRYVNNTGEYVDIESVLDEIVLAFRDASPATGDSRPDNYAHHDFKQGGYLSDPEPNDRCVWRVDGTSPYCGITRTDHDDVLAQRRGGTWRWGDSRQSMRGSTDDDPRFDETVGADADGVVPPRLGAAPPEPDPDGNRQASEPLVGDSRQSEGLREQQRGHELNPDHLETNDVFERTEL